MAGSDCTVALWWLRHGRPGYRLFGNEQAAADFATYFADYGAGSVLGAQTADGEVIHCDRWDAYREARERHPDESAQGHAAVTETPMRETRDPFTGQPVMVETSEPLWVGKWWAA